MEDYKKLVNRLREEPKDSRKAVLSIYDLCVDAACAIESLLDKLKYAEAERDAVTRHMIELEQEVCRLKSRLAAYEDSGLEPEEIADFMKRWEQTVEIGGMLKKYCIDHIRDILHAEQDGRLVVIPWAAGDVIYEADPAHGVVKHTFSGEPAWMMHSYAVDDAGNEWYDGWGSSDETPFYKTREEAEAALKGGEGL